VEGLGGFGGLGDLGGLGVWEDLGGFWSLFRECSDV